MAKYKVIVEEAAEDAVDGMMIELDRTADYILVLNDKNANADSAGQISHALRRAFKRPVPVLVTSGEVRFVKVPKGEQAERCDSASSSPYPGGNTFIQWKGTNVCMDWICPVCDEQYHVDADFCYFLKCLECGSLFKVGTAVSLTLQDSTTDENDKCVVASSSEIYV